MSVPKFENLVQMFERSVERYGSRDLFGTKKRGAWTWTTYKQFGKLVDEFRGGLASLGIKRGDRVAIVSNNRVEWAVAAYACYGLGAALVPMYEAQLSKEWVFIVNDCEAVAIIAATDEILGKWKELQKETPSLQHIIGFSLPKSEPLSYEALLEAGRNNPVPPIQPEAKDIACLIYTSGTTGNPKGVILTHENLSANLTSMHRTIELEPGERTLSFLPWAHSFGHTCELHWMVSSGGSMALCESIDKIIPNLAEVHPTLLLSVPRIFNRIYDGVNKQMSHKPAPIQKLFHAGLRIAAEERAGKAVGLFDKLILTVADRLVFSKVRQKFGGRLKYAISGGAAISKEVAAFIDGLGITLLQGYGLTETAPLVAVNVPDASRLGSVGRPIPGVKVVIDKEASGDPKEGELIVYGENVMVGYHNREDETKAVFTEDGGFRTGDLGYLDDDGFLYITGRIKEQYKLENGKYVAPSPLEEHLKLSPFVANAMVYGSNRLYNVALLVPDMDSLKEWAKEQGISFDSDDKLLESPKVKELLMGEVDKYSVEWKGFEKVKDICLVAEDFTTQNGLLTPSLKLKRRVAWQKYGPMIEALYEKAGGSKKSAQAA